MEITDRNIVQRCLKLPNSNVSLNDGTNGCAFLAIGVIDNCSSLSIFDPNILTNEITLTITEFPKKFNPDRNVQECVDIYEACSILNCNNLLEHTFTFTEKLVDNLLLMQGNVMTSALFQNRSYHSKIILKTLYI